MEPQVKCETALHAHAQAGATPAGTGLPCPTPRHARVQWQVRGRAEGVARAAARAGGRLRHVELLLGSHAVALLNVAHVFFESI